VATRAEELVPLALALAFCINQHHTYIK
jgi:hypothetical protein